MLSLVRLFLLVSPPLYIYMCIYMPNVFEWLGGGKRRKVYNSDRPGKRKGAPPSVFLSRGSVRVKKEVTIRRQRHTGLYITVCFLGCVFGEVFGSPVSIFVLFNAGIQTPGGLERS